MGLGQLNDLLETRTSVGELGLESESSWLQIWVLFLP